MPRLKDRFALPAELVLGVEVNRRVPAADQVRQREEVAEILSRLRSQSGIILADEVGMGKTFVGLAVAYSVASANPRGPVILMVPPNLVEKWEQDLATFAELYLANRRPIRSDTASRGQRKDNDTLVYGVARHSVELMRLLDDPPGERSKLIFLAQGAMGRRQTDKWVRLALVSEALRRHARRGGGKLIKVKANIHRFMARLLHARGEERAHDLGEDLWNVLLRKDPSQWMVVYNSSLSNEERRLQDDPVPKSVLRALDRIDLRDLADALMEMPIRASRSDTRIRERLDYARDALRAVEEGLWKQLLAEARWRSPLLVMDEAHHLKNPGTLLARQLQSPDSDQDLRTGDGAMANAFDRMLFLTATPFQLGHRELINVLHRFGDVRWATAELGEKKAFEDRLESLAFRLDESQRAAIHLQRTWARLRADDVGADVEAWWQSVCSNDAATLKSRDRAVRFAFEGAVRARRDAETELRPWIIRHNKATYWSGTQVRRRVRVDGAFAQAPDSVESQGVPIPADQLLPFFLAARSASGSSRDLLGVALSSSYEAFRHTRQDRRAVLDEQEEPVAEHEVGMHSRWYLEEFDRALEKLSGSIHPKISPSVERIVDLWEGGEKVLVFGFYRHTCSALRVHISREIERRLFVTVRRRLKGMGPRLRRREIRSLLKTIQRRYCDDADAPGRRAVDAALMQIVETRQDALDRASVSAAQRENLVDVMRRFLRVQTTLARCFPIRELETIDPALAVRRTLDHPDKSGMSWRDKFHLFIDFLTDYCSGTERQLYLEAAGRTQTGSIRVKRADEQSPERSSKATALANVQVATGETRRGTRARLMRAFNTPFFPDILVCSEVMGEGVDLQRFCRHVIHHDLAWNPSTIEQRTGRIDRIGCKAEGKHSIELNLPYIAGAADERQHRVMSDRENWFRIVMGQEKVSELIPISSESMIPLPAALADELSFRLSL